jgi:N6-adenosine-specific RNA methylase IME4
VTKRTKPDNLPFPPAPQRRYACAAIDIPWHFESRAASANPQSVRSPQRHYPTADVAHMCTLPMRDFLERDAFVFLWITGPMLIQGAHLVLADAYGLRLSSMVFVWVKTKRGFDMDLLRRTPLLEEDLFLNTGFTTMQNAEYVVLLRRGSPRRLRTGIRQMIIAPVTEHSRKPDEFFRRAELYCAGPRIDMFGGRRREGWDHWGFHHRDSDRHSGQLRAAE